MRASSTPGTTAFAAASAATPRSSEYDTDPGSIPSQYRASLEVLSREYPPRGYRRPRQAVAVWKGPQRPGTDSQRPPKAPAILFSSDSLEAGNIEVIFAIVAVPQSISAAARPKTAM